MTDTGDLVTQNLCSVVESTARSLTTEPHLLLVHGGTISFHLVSRISALSGVDLL